MTRFVIDATAVIHLVSEGVEVAAGHELLAPTLIRSQVLSTLHESVTSGDVSATAGIERLQAAWRLPMRLLGDAVLRRRAWDLAAPDGVVLLAPACSSFDMFADYADRGRQFKEEVLRLIEA